MGEEAIPVGHTSGATSSRADGRNLGLVFTAWNLHDDQGVGTNAATSSSTTPPTQVTPPT